MTNMVFEFTDTQGVMGMHYARHDGESEDVALALKSSTNRVFLEMHFHRLMFPPH